MDLVYLVYGLAFLALGLVLVIWPKRDSQFELASLCRWLAAFALIHGLLEWLDLWRVVHGENPALASLTPFVLLLSYMFLFEFGRRLALTSLAGASPASNSRPALLDGRVHALLLAGVAAGSLLSDNVPRNLAIWSRYLFGFTGATLTGAAFMLYCARRIRPALGDREFAAIRRACVWAGAAFIAYGVLGGLVVPRADWAPAAWLNQESFRDAIGIPVQVFRAACAVVIAFSVGRMLRIFHLEGEHRFRAALNRTGLVLAEKDRLARHNRLLLDSVAEGIFGVDRAGRTTFINPAALSMLGLSGREILGEPMHRITRHGPAEGQSPGMDESPIHGALRDGQTRHVADDVFWQAGGTGIRVEYNVAAIRENDETVGAVIVFQDITGRRQAESALRESEALLRTVIDENPNVICMKDRDGRFLMGNQALATLYGTTPEGLIGKDDGDFIHDPGQAEFFRRNVREVMEGGVPQVVLETSINANTGEVRHFQSVKKPLKGPGGEPRILVIANDVTELKRAQRKIEDSEQRLSFVFEAAQEGLWDWDLRTNVVDHNTQWCRLLGFEDDLLSHPVDAFADLVHEADRERVMAALQLCLTSGDPYRSEHRMKRANGDPIWVSDRGNVVVRDADGKPLRMVGSVSDISDRKAKEEALQRSRGEIERLLQRNQLLLDAAGEGIYGVDHVGRVIFINPAALALLGLTEAEALGRDSHALFHHHRPDGTDYPVTDCPLYQTLRDTVRREAQDHFIRKNGEVFPVQLVATPMIDDTEQVGAEVVFQDITRQKAMEAELTRLATTDSLTGLPNRRNFMEQLEMELARIHRYGNPAALLMLDLDHFKHINDNHGHGWGDAMLRAFARTLREHLRRTDLVGRLGGEEFAILLPATEIAAAGRFAEGLRERVAGMVLETGRQALRVTVSIGISSLEQNDVLTDAALARADAALYRAKSAGRNRVELSP
jgi:diguanylate cyclase (GGDEF)-like protein/PAS domain S-box-containing protein